MPQKKTPQNKANLTSKNDAPTLATSNSFSDFMNRMATAALQPTQVRRASQVDARSGVLIALADVLVAATEAATALGSMAVEAPVIQERHNFKSVPRWPAE
jgi:hypothetical protein